MIRSRPPGFVEDFNAVESNTVTDLWNPEILHSRPTGKAYQLLMPRDLRAIQPTDHISLLANPKPPAYSAGIFLSQDE